MRYRPELTPLSTESVSESRDVPPLPAARPMARRRVDGERVLADKSGPLSPQQVAEYRSRLQRGFYSSPAVVTEVARRIVESGDL